MNQDKIRNVAIIAHVDHGKTTMVDQLFKQSGMFRSNQAVEERLMDSMDLERERGITIQSKNGACKYKDFFINIIDTPGHADFGGEVERVLLMADGVLLLVDAAEGPMPQSYFVLKKALAKDLPVIVVINKVDKPAARPDWVIDQVFDLFVELGAKESILDFPIIYSSAKNGWATFDLNKPNSDIFPVFEKIVEYIPAPKGDINNPFQMLVSSISYSSFLGKLSIGKVTQGKIDVNQEVAIAFGDTIKAKKRISKIYKFDSNKQVEAKSAQVGEIIAVAGLEEVKVGETLTDPINPNPASGIEIDPPTLSMLFCLMIRLCRQRRKICNFSSFRKDCLKNSYQMSPCKLKTVRIPSATKFQAEESFTYRF
jgi:GTP-binding protein